MKSLLIFTLLLFTVQTIAQEDEKKLFKNSDNGFTPREMASKNTDMLNKVLSELKSLKAEVKKLQAKVKKLESTKSSEDKQNNK